MATRLDIARRLYGQRGSSALSTVGAISGGQTGSLAMRYGTATADSSGGRVSVRLDTSSIDDGSGEDAPVVSCICDTPISEGQRVAVLTTSDGQLKAIPIGDNILGEANQGSVSDVVMEYAEGTDSTTAPQSGWSESYPTTADYVWQRTKTTYKDGTVAYGEPACIARPPEGYENDATFYATSSSSSATAAKVATVQSGGSFSLEVGATVSVTFSSANSAANPTLNVNSTGAKPIRTNGTPYAYWAAGASVLFVYDGTYWQVASTPVYASTVTVGNPAAQNLYIDGQGIATRNGTTEYSTFGPDDIHLGLNASTDANIYLFNDAIRMNARSASLAIEPVPGNDAVDMRFSMSDEDYLLLRAPSGDFEPETILSGSVGVRLNAPDGDVSFYANRVDVSNSDCIIKPAITIGATAGSVSKSMTISNAVFTGATTITEVGSGIGTSVTRSGNYVLVSLKPGATAYMEASAIATVQNVSNSNLAVGIFCSRYSGSGTATPEESFGSLTTWGNGGYCTPTVTPQVFTLRNTSSYNTATFRFSLQGRVTNATGTLIGWMLTVKMI